MGPLQIVVNQEEYKILDTDENQTIVKGITSFRTALTVYERLISLKESVARFAQTPCQTPMGMITASSH